jgi:hypothetical protein
MRQASAEQPIGQCADQSAIEVNGAAAHPGRDTDPLGNRSLELNEVDVVAGSGEVLVRAEVAQWYLLDIATTDGGECHAPIAELEPFLFCVGKLRSGQERRGAEQSGGQQKGERRAPHSVCFLSAALMASTMKFCMEGRWPRTAE